MYHINAVDEVTQWEIVASVEKIAESYLVPVQEVMTPYEKFKSLPTAESYLRPGITIKKLDDVANQMSDNEFAERMVKARSNLFQNISRWAERVARGYSPSTSPTAPQGKKDSQKKRNRITTSPCSFFD